MTMSITLHVGRGEHRGPLTVFPIWRQGSTGPDVPLAQSAELLVGELAEPRVPQLQVTAKVGTQYSCWTAICWSAGCRTGSPSGRDCSRPDGRP